GEESVIVVRRGDEIFAIGGTCTHYGGPLGEGVVYEDTVRCPWHHACFSLRTGEALHAPALNPVSCWNVEISGESLFVSERRPDSGRPTDAHISDGDVRATFVIIGAGAAGHAA